MDEQPFSDLKTLPYEFLDKLQGRSECPECKRSRKYYCYTCFVPVTQLQGQIPRVKLPIKIDVIKHPSEVDGKSTSAHAKVLAPDDVNIYTYPCIPDYPRDGTVVLVFPGEDASTLDDLVKNKSLVNSYKSKPLRLEKCVKDKTNTYPTSCKAEENITPSSNKTDIENFQETDSGNNKSENDEDNEEKSIKKEENLKHLCKSGDADHLLENDNLQKGTKRKIENNEEDEKNSLCQALPFERAVFIDSTWNQTNRISTDERLKGLPCIMLKNRESKFWRHQKEFPATYLATIEAIYYLVRDFHDLCIPTNYEGEYDNLLFFFVYMYDKIHGLYTDRILKADSSRKKLKS